MNELLSGAMPRFIPDVDARGDRINPSTHSAVVRVGDGSFDDFPVS